MKMRKTMFRTLAFRKKLLTTGILAAMLATPALAKVPAEQAARLGKDLTAIGAEKGANADGTIPAFTGGLTEAPACYKGGSFLCNPFPDDKPKFVIDRSNLDQYRDKLSPGQIAMFEKFDTFKMRVFETRRSATVPEEVQAETKKNAVSAELVTGGNGLANFSVRGYPFPIPQSGVEAIWNHTVRYRGQGAERVTGQAVPQANGAYNIVFFLDQVVFRDYLTDMDDDEDRNVLFYFKQQVTSPARLAGNVLLAHETIDQVAEPRKAWIYNAGQRRVRRAPQVSYDGPGTAADGQRTADQFDMYNGAPDRYDWKLIGKKEMYIPYNSYELDEKGVPYDKIIHAGHLNPDMLRYELHRVWVVESKLKSGTRHIYGGRTFYLDEDSWQAAVIDLYDGRGNLWRVQEAYMMQYYNATVPWYAMETVYDLQNGRYLALGLENNESDGVVFDGEYSKVMFNPAALRQSGVR